MPVISDIFKNHTKPGKVAFIGDYLPRRCGIATFTYDLYQSFALQFRETGSFVVSVNDVKEGYDYPPEVRFTFFQHDIEEYKNAAYFLNSQQVEVVCLQHEYGIYGGRCGDNVVQLLRELKMPVVTTLHTVLDKPTTDQYNVMKQIISLSSKVVVMSEKGRVFLRDVYEAPSEKIEFIPHGIPDIPFVDAHFYKDIFGLSDRKTLLTFGLLSPNKGIETLISILPEVTKSVPNLTYIIVGATHPHLIREHGEAYRDSLIALATKLGVEKHIQFYNQFVSKRELMEFIGAADIYITPYLNPTQITSGTLAYSLGCGKAIISTPYWYAEELLADDCGVITPFGDSEKMTEAIVDLLGNDQKRNLLRKKAYLKGREMTWEKVVISYEAALTSARLKRLTYNEDHPLKHTKEVAKEADGFPKIKLDQLFRLSDSTGIFQHARYCFPNYNDGYCTDDNARALALTMEMRQYFPTEINNLSDTFIAFINHAFIEKTNGFHNFMSLERTWLDTSSSEDCQGRTLWALGSVVAEKVNLQMQQWALDLFEKALPNVAHMTSPRAWAYSLLGINKYAEFFAGDRFVALYAELLENKMMDIFNRASSPEWQWFEEELSYDNARLCQAMLVSKRAACRTIGIKALRWLRDVQTSETGYFQPIGSNGFYRKSGKRAYFDQQPIEASAMVSACISAFKLTNAKEWIEEAKKAFGWFMGKNVAGVVLYSEQSGGCCDGLHVDRANLNQGAESTIVFLSALTEIKKMSSFYQNTKIGVPLTYPIFDGVEPVPF